MNTNVWKQLLTAVQRFVPNEYVAACGEENKVYKFKCDAGGGVNGAVYEDTNNNGKLDFGDEELTSYLPAYHACGKTHEAPTDDEFIKGFYTKGVIVGYLNPTPVIIWTEGGTNVHCTTNLKMDSWETAKS